MAELIPIFLKEVNNEAVTTKKMLERIPEDKLSWKPHEKSMTIKALATHIAELNGWVGMALTSDGLDFASNPYQPAKVENKHDLMKVFNENLEIAQSHLRPEFENKLSEKWVLRNGEQVLADMNKAEVIRLALNQITHHRAQLGVYLRLLDVPIPGSYGPSADEQ